MDVDVKKEWGKSGVLCMYTAVDETIAHNCNMKCKVFI